MPALTATERSHHYRAKVWNDDQKHEAAKAKDRDKKKATMTEWEKNEKKQKEREAKQRQRRGKAKAGGRARGNRAIQDQEHAWKGCGHGNMCSTWNANEGSTCIWCCVIIDASR